MIRKPRVPLAVSRHVLVFGAVMIGLATVVAAFAFFPSLSPAVNRSAEQTAPGYPQVPEGADRTALVATDVLNVREAASADAAVLAAHPRGQRVTIVGEPVNGFLPVAHGTGQGWMAAAYLALDDQSPAAFDAAVERWIEVDRSTATVFLHEGAGIVATFHAKIGSDPSDDGYYSTALGTFHVYSMTKALTITPFAEDAYLTDWVGFDPNRGNGFHSPIRDASGVEKRVQEPTTKGCVRLDATAAERVFAFASLGMRVEVHD